MASPPTTFDDSCPMRYRYWESMSPEWRTCRASGMGSPVQKAFTRTVGNEGEMGELLGCATRALLLTLLCGILVGAAAAPSLAQDAPAGKKAAKAAPRKDAKAEK